MAEDKELQLRMDLCRILGMLGQNKTRHRTELKPQQQAECSAQLIATRGLRAEAGLICLSCLAWEEDQGVGRRRKS